MNAMQVFRFLPIPTELHFGFGVVESLPERVRQVGGSKVLLVTDEGLSRAGVTARIQEILQRGGIEATVFDRVKPDGSTGIIAEGYEVYRSTGADAVVGVGGGSSLDTAKAIAVLATNEGPITRYAGYGKVEKDPAPVIAIPTTAGTGSEVSLWAVMTNDETGWKMSVGGIGVYPDIALCDPELTLSLPPAVTAATGMDALTHAIETFTNTATQPISDALCLRAIELIGAHLRTAVAKGTQREARYAMLLASTMAGMAMNSTRLGISHALAMPLGSKDWKIPHGVANAITLPHVMRFNVIGNMPKFAQVAAALGEPIEGLSLRAAAERAADAVEQLARDIGIPKGLAEFGVTEAVLPEIADVAMRSDNITVNPRQPTRDDLIEIMRAAL